MGSPSPLLGGIASSVEGPRVGPVGPRIPQVEVLLGVAKTGVLSTILVPSLRATTLVPANVSRPTSEVRIPPVGGVPTPVGTEASEGRHYVCLDIFILSSVLPTFLSGP